MIMSVHLITGHAETAHVTAADAGSFNAALLGSGAYIMNIGNKCDIQVVSNNSVKILDGDILFQGRHIRITGTEELTIENGTQELSRNDLIVLKYSKDSNTGLESAELKVVKGTPGETATDPTITSGDILSGDLVSEVAIYRLPLSGINLGTPIRLINYTENFQAKADASDLTAHTGDTDIHVTAAQKTVWDGKVNKSGDEMTGDLRISKSQFPRVLLKESTNNTQSQIMLGTKNLAMGIYNVQEGNTYRQLTLFNSDAKTLEQSFVLADVVSGTNNLYPVYGTHNVTVSTAAPTTTLGNGVIHMVYDA